MKQIISNIRNSPGIVRSAWWWNIPTVARMMTQLGKSTSTKVLEKHTAQDPAINYNNFLATFKLFWGGTYQAGRKRGEIIFADLMAFRALFTGDAVIVHESPKKIFNRLTPRWFELIEVFILEDFTRADVLINEIIGELFQIRRAFAGLFTKPQEVFA